MKRSRARFLTVMFIVASLVGTVLGQAAGRQRAELKGVVTDEAKAVIPGAALSLFGEQGRIRDTVSAEDGAFSFGELPLG